MVNSVDCEYYVLMIIDFIIIIILQYHNSNSYFRYITFGLFWFKV